MSTFEVNAQADSPAGGVIVVHGDVDLATAPELFKAAEQAMNANPGGLSIDLSDVTFIDSTGLGVLIRIRNALAESGRELAIVAPSRSVERAMSLAGLSEVFGIPIAE